MASRKPPEGKKRVNFYVDAQQYAIFQKVSGFINMTFTDLIDNSLRQVNASILNAVNTGSAEGMIDFYNKQVEQMKKELSDVTEEMKSIENEKLKKVNQTVKDTKIVLNENL